MHLFQSILAAAPGQQSSSLMAFLPMLLVLGIFYLLVIAPMRKKQKAHTEMVAQIKNGDRVVTNGGIHGTVVGVGDDVLQLRIADQVKVDISRSAISGFLDGRDAKN